MALSVFEKKTAAPGEEDLARVLGNLHPLWNELKRFVLTSAPDVYEEWSFSGKSSGWGFRLKNPKKVILYLTPCNGIFKAGFVFGPAATEEIMRSNTISEEVKEIVDSAKVYAEGRGVRFDVTDESRIEDLKRLIEIKLGIKNLNNSK